MFAHELARINTNVVFVGQGYALSLRPHKLVLQVAVGNLQNIIGVWLHSSYNCATPTGFFADAFALATIMPPRRVCDPVILHI